MNERLEMKIRNMIAAGNYISVAQLSRLDGFNGEDTFWLSKHIVLWVGASKEAGEILDRLRKEDVFHYEEVSYISGRRHNTGLASRQR